jgi:hypothetical protein
MPLAAQVGPLKAWWAWCRITRRLLEPAQTRLGFPRATILLALRSCFCSFVCLFVCLFVCPLVRLLVCSPARCPGVLMLRPLGVIALGSSTHRRWSIMSSCPPRLQGHLLHRARIVCPIASFRGLGLSSACFVFWGRVLPSCLLRGIATSLGSTIVLSLTIYLKFSAPHTSTCEMGVCVYIESQVRP